MRRQNSNAGRTERCAERVRERLSVRLLRLSVPLLRLSVPLLRLSVPLLRPSVPLLRPSVPLLRLSVPHAKQNSNADQERWAGRVRDAARRAHRAAAGGRAERRNEEWRRHRQRLGGLTPPAPPSAPGLGSPPAHISTGTGLTPHPHLHRDRRQDANEAAAVLAYLGRVRELSAASGYASFLGAVEWLST
jgi:hypothetical protein